MQTFPLHTPNLTALLILAPLPIDDQLATVITWKGKRLAIGHDSLPVECWDEIDAAWAGAARLLSKVARPSQRQDVAALSHPDAAWIKG
jgi:hypothetical protein